MRALARIFLVVVVFLPALGVAQELTLERIMADPDWISRQPENPYWSDDGRFVYYQRKREGSELRDLYRVDAASGETVRVEDRDRAAAGAPGGDWDSTWTARVFAREGDLYLSRDGSIRQLTRTAATEEDPLFLVGDREIAFRRGDAWLARDLESGLERQLAEVRLEKDPETKEPADDYLSRQQERLLDIVAQRKARKEEAEERARAERRDDPSRVPPPFYVGEKLQITQSHLSPSGRALVVVLAKSDAAAPKRDRMPDFITESGYVEVRDLRPKVGVPAPETPRVVLFDLAGHAQHELSFDALPGLKDDPLKELRAKAEAAKKARAAELAKGDGEEKAAKDETKADDRKSDGKKGDEKKPQEAKARVLSVDDVIWNDDGTRVALQLFSFDNKDRWIAAVDPGAAKPALQPLVRTTDEAWINWDFRELGWMRDGRTVWYLSEETGFSHLWLQGAVDEKAKPRQLTRGDFVVEDPVLSRDGRSFLVSAHREHPGVVETYRVDAASGALERLTAFGGLTEFFASPDGSQLAVLASTFTRPPELYIQAAQPGAAATRRSDTITAEFAAVDWSVPEVVAVPSSHAKAPVYSRVYTPGGWSADGSHPAVVFVHGAGYLQNAHKGWSTYFREFMFHTLLTRAGYVVLDMDYRASAGYGRDWRTAIYRRMGTPELEDLQDGVRWLITNKAVDPERVGVYGGSYGGFMTFMALFKDPDLFACGAALRPVADWAHYNHPYTSNILNTPEVDPEAYERSSPIEFAAGLRKPLLILHGMVDDNVVFQDTVRLVQKLIELKKTRYFETAIYPVEPHAFKEPSGWLDEYTRIWLLMEEHLK
jgi:dipeptidyl aminopeptidase/acylaminoacyl peptidase